jgi:hypothetical protein
VDHKCLSLQLQGQEPRAKSHKPAASGQQEAVSRNFHPLSIAADCFVPRNDYLNWTDCIVPLNDYFNWGNCFVRESQMFITSTAGPRAKSQKHKLKVKSQKSEVGSRSANSSTARRKAKSQEQAASGQKPEASGQKPGAGVLTVLLHGQKPAASSQ